MKINKITFQHKDGSLHYIENPIDIERILLALPPKLMWKHTANIETLHNKYFAMLTELAKNSNSGYSKEALHEALKPLIFGKFADFPHYFKNNNPTNSTQHLTYEGWLATIEQLKVVANDIFGYVFLN